MYLVAAVLFNEELRFAQSFASFSKQTITQFDEAPTSHPTLEKKMKCTRGLLACVTMRLKSTKLLLLRDFPEDRVFLVPYFTNTFNEQFKFFFGTSSRFVIVAE